MHQQLLNKKQSLHPAVALCCLLLASLTACRKFITIPQPQAQVTTANLFTDSASATSAINGLYGQMMNTNLYLANGGITVFTALAADEVYNPTPNAALDPYTANAISPSDQTTLSNRLWVRAYSHIYQANAILEGLSKSSTVPAAVKTSLSGEAKLVRAFCYFYLVNLFGEVPLVTTTDYAANSSRQRISVNEVYEQLIRDLKDAGAELPTSYAGNLRTRPGKWTATAFLARVYLYRQQWKEAEDAATAVIGAGMYSLPANLSDVFLASGGEAIWQLQPVISGFNTGEGNAFVPGSATVKPTYTITPFLLNAFEAGDARKNAWLKSNTVAGQTYFYPAKYKVRIGSTVSEYAVVFRLGEQYLIRAEARAQQDKLTEAVADLNKIRARAGLPGTPATGKPALLLAIEKERQTELFTEWGHRWLDLKRTGRINAVLGAEKTMWTSAAALFPLPLSELLADPFLTQNPGY